MNALALLVVSLLLGLPSAAGQSTRPASRPTSLEEGRAILAAIDRRVYCASSHGLEALSFAFHPQRNDPRTSKALGPASFKVRYQWRKGVGDRVDFVGKDGKVTPHLEQPGEAPQKQMGFEQRRRKVRLQFLGYCKAFREFFLGRTMQDRFRNYRIDVLRQTVNRREEISLVLEPLRPKRYRRLRITLDRNGLPWRWNSLRTDGWRQGHTREYKQRPEGWVLKSYKTIHSPPNSRTKGASWAVDITFQRVSGFLLPASIRKNGRTIAPHERGLTSFVDVLVNDEVPSFEPMAVPELPGLDNRR